MGRHGFFTQHRFPLALVLALALFILQRMGGREEAVTTPIVYSSPGISVTVL